MTAVPSPSILPPTDNYCYRYSPSTSLSSCSISDFALACNFQELANKYPDFQTELGNSRGGRQRNSLPRCNTLSSQNGDLVNNQKDDQYSRGVPDGEHNNSLGAEDNSTSTSSTTTTSNSKHAARRPFLRRALSTQTTHAFDIALTRALLQHNFQLKLPSLPRGHLCPPVPNRANYICWLRELLKRSRSDLYRFSSFSVESCTAAEEQQEEGDVPSAGGSAKKWALRGLDIGTGVSAIYPLLLTTSLFGDPFGNDDESEARGDDNNDHDAQCKTAKCRRQWTFLATDIDPVAIESARINIQANSLDEQIQVLQVNDDADSALPDKSMEPRGPLFAALDAFRGRSCQFDDEVESTPEGLSQYPNLDFVMTNPPFYESVTEATLPRAGDKRARTDMSANESVYKRTFDADNEGGGDVGFITSIMNDSQFFRHYVTWYTSLIAKRSSLDVILKRLETLDGVWGNRGQIRTVEFRQRNIESSYSDEIRERGGSARVRWGIGWTYERAIGRCSACRVRGGLQSFDVWVPASGGDADDILKNACDDVASRLITCFENIRDISLKCFRQIREYGSDNLPQRIDESGKRKALCVTAIEERFCNSITPGFPLTSNENDNENLPIEGHFVLDAFLESNGIYNEKGEVSVRVIFELFSHTKYGSLCVDKIRSFLPGEIRRTNRRWKRKLKEQELF